MSIVANTVLVSVFGILPLNAYSTKETMCENKTEYSIHALQRKNGCALMRSKL